MQYRSWESLLHSNRGALDLLVCNEYGIIVGTQGCLLRSVNGDRLTCVPSKTFLIKNNT